MSTYYYAVCDKHQVVSPVIGGRSFPDRWWANNGGELEGFLCDHGDCIPCPQIVSEHDERTLTYGELPVRVEPPSEPVPLRAAGLKLLAALHGESPVDGPLLGSGARW